MTSIKNDDITIGEMSKRKTEQGLDLSSVFVAIALFYYFIGNVCDNYQLYDN